MTAPITVESPDALRELLNELLDRWERGARMTTGRRGAGEDQVTVTFALATHVHRLAATVLLLQDHDRGLESFPLVRSAFEHALTAQWLAQYPHGIHGFVNESLRQNKNLLTTVAQTGWASAVELLDQVDAVAPTKHPADDAARHIKQLCDDLVPAGTQAYTMYRILCQYTHPTPRIVESYISRNPLIAHSFPAGYQETDNAMWLFFTCASTIWAARAFDMLEDGHPRSKELRKAAKRLEIPPQFQLSPALQQRDQAHRRAKWQGPRARGC